MSKNRLADYYNRIFRSNRTQRSEPAWTLARALKHGANDLTVGRR
jgi:hypothetical protein